jgi:hypothetical protein
MAVKGIDEAVAAPLRDHMRRTVQTVLDAAAWIRTDTPDGKRPTRAQLRASGTAGFFVDATVTKLSVEDDPDISCAVSVVVATYPEKSMFGFFNGASEALLTPGANEAAPFEEEIASARRRCVADVLEFIILKQALPALRNRTPA